MIDTKTPDTPGWWLAECWKKLDARRERYARLDAWRRGDPPLSTRHEAQKEAFRAFLKMARLNLADTLVSCVSERLNVRAIRTSKGSTADGDDLAWSLFKLNALHVEFGDTIEDALGLSDGYLMVSVDPTVTGNPAAKDVWITTEDPRQVVTFHDPVRQSKVRAAAKFYHDAQMGDGGTDLAYLYLPGRVYVATKPRKRAAGDRDGVRFSASGWTWRDVDENDLPIATPLPAGFEDVVPVVRMRNRKGVAEFERHIDHLERITHGVLQRMVIVTMQAFRQRALRGELPSHYPNDYPVEELRGQEIDYEGMFESSPDAMWLLPAGVEVWESQQADMQGVLSAVNDDLKHLAAATRRPMHIFAPDNQSAAGAESADDGLMFACEDRATRFGDALARAMAIAFRFMGEDERAELDKITVDWQPFVRHDIQTKANAAAQAKAAGMSDAWILENVWQATPEEARIETANKAADQLSAALLTGTGPGTPPAPPTPAPAPAPGPAEGQPGVPAQGATT